MSVEFEPVRLGRRGPRIDPVAVGAIAVLIALGVAVIKPWAGSGPASGVVVEVSSSPTASSRPTESRATAEVALPRIIQARPASRLTWAAVEPVVRRHETWGIRAMVVKPPVDDGPAPSRLTERWIAVTPSDADLVPTAQLDPSDRSIVALGITFPPSRTPLDVRFWRATRAGLEWVETEFLDPVPSGGAFLFARPIGGAGQPQPWLAGTYRIDVLEGGSIRRLELTIPDRFFNVPEAPERPSLRDTGPFVPPSKAPLSDLPVGLFATSGGVAVPLASEPGAALDEARAWLNLDPGTRRTPRSFVASAYLPGATGLGVALPTGSRVTTAVLERLAPEALTGQPDRVDPGADGAASSLVLFRAPNGGPWTPGVYRLSLAWTDFNGRQEGSWHVELLPGQPRQPGPLLVAARAWVRYAGATGVILGTAEPLEGGPRDSRIRLVRLRPEGADYPAQSGVGCGGTVIAGRPAILGLGYPADTYETRVSARIRRPFLRSQEVVLMTAAFGVPGLVLVAPARSRDIHDATYEFVVGEAPHSTTYVLCHGMETFDD